MDNHDLSWAKAESTPESRLQSAKLDATTNNDLSWVSRDTPRLGSRVRWFVLKHTWRFRQLRMIKRIRQFAN